MVESVKCSQVGDEYPKSLEASFVFVPSTIDELLDSFVLVPPEPQDEPLSNSTSESVWAEWSFNTNNTWGEESTLNDLSASTIDTINLEVTALSPKTYRIQNNDGVPYFFVDQYFAEGNYGLAYLCHDAFGQEFVLKCLKTIRPPEELKNDWEKEKEMLHGLTHPNIIGLYDAFVHDQYYYLVMEKADGSLREYVTKYGNLSNNRVIEIGGQILSAINHIHSKNIIHRDLHVDNVLFAYDKATWHDAAPAEPRAENKIIVKVADFGISKQLLPEEDFSSSFIGRNYDYAPELLNEYCTTKKSDLYQVGLILYYCATGRAAISEDDGSVVDVTVSGLAAERALQLKTELGGVIGKLLSVEPEERFRNCIDTWGALQKCKI